MARRRAADKIETAMVAASPGDEVLLMTDGFAALADGYGALDDPGMIAAMRRKGVGSVAAELRAIEAGDAECTRFPRFKQSDDATAVWLRIVE